MATRTTLKTYFETGDIPTETQFADLIDSTFNINDDTATQKGSIVDDDEILIKDSEAAGDLRTTLWSTLKTAINSLYEPLKLTTKGDLLTRSASASVRIAVGTDGQVLKANSAVANGIEWADESGGSGHTIKDNGTPLAQRTGLNFTGATVTDDAGSDETDVVLTHDALNDTDATGKADGDLIKWNNATSKYETQPTTPFTSQLNSTQANINTNVQLSLILPAGYKIDTIILKETAGNAAGDISIGSTALGTDIVNTVTVGASAEVDATLGTKFFSTTLDTDLYISSSAWGTGIVQIYLTLTKII